MINQTARALLLAPVLCGFWLLLSGNYATWLVISSVICSILVVVFARVQGVIDDEGFAVEDLPRALVYWPWLIWQIILSGLNVARLILSPERISPTMVAVEALPSSGPGITNYANSITLTPGTISVEVSELRKRIWVHAITRENADAFADDPMNEWAAWVDGER